MSTPRNRKLLVGVVGACPPAILEVVTKIMMQCILLF